MKNSQTIGLSPRSVFSEQDLQQLIVQNRKIPPYDVDVSASEVMIFSPQ
jgi:hypothetical protein